MITEQQIASASTNELRELKNQLIIQKMKLNKFFSVFLNNTMFDEKDTTTPEWFTYREMYKDYGKIDDLIKSADYKLGQYNII